MPSCHFYDPTCPYFPLTSPFTPQFSSLAHPSLHILQMLLDVSLCYKSLIFSVLLSGFIAPYMLDILKVVPLGSPFFSFLAMNIRSHQLDVIIQLSHRQLNFTVSRPEPNVSPPPNITLLLLLTSNNGITFNVVAQEIYNSSLISPLPQPTHPTI